MADVKTPRVGIIDVAVQLQRSREQRKIAELRLICITVQLHAAEKCQFALYPRT